MKKLNNKGFSLVELIIVIAIMVILVAVLAPQFTKYVERSRVGTDVQNASEIATAVQVAIAEGKISADVASAAVDTSVLTSLGSAPVVKSNTVKNAGSGTAFTYTVADDCKTVEVYGAGVELYPDLNSAVSEYLEK